MSDDQAIPEFIKQERANQRPVSYTLYLTEREYLDVLRAVMRGDVQGQGVSLAIKFALTSALPHRPANNRDPA